MIGNIIKTKREELGLTQNEVAEYLSISPQAISKWERGVADPTIEYLPKLSKLFSCSIDSLFDLDTLDNFDFINSKVVQLTKTGNFDKAKKFILSNSVEFEFFEMLFDDIKNNIKSEKQHYNCSNVQCCFNFSYYKALAVIEWLIDLKILKRSDDILPKTIIDNERYYEIKSLLFSEYSIDYFQDIGSNLIQEFFATFNENPSQISDIIAKSKPLKELVNSIYNELINENKINVSILQMLFEIDYALASEIFDGLTLCQLIIKKGGIFVGNKEKLKILSKYL